jgi:hypothetical protein
VFLRLFYLKKLIEFKEKEKEAMENSGKTPNKSVSRSNIARGK